MTETKLYYLHRFNGQNYQLWKYRMEIYIVKNKLKIYIHGSIFKFESKAENAASQIQKDTQAQKFLMVLNQINSDIYSDSSIAAQM